MSRFFSSSRQQAKALKWKLNGTTENVDWVKGLLEAAVDHLPEIKDQVDSAIVNGNPHPTGNDPMHASGAIGKGSVKNKNRVASYHAYPDGTVTFSNKKLPRLKITSTGVQRVPDANDLASALMGQRSSQQQIDQPSSTPAGWVYDDVAKSHKHWDGADWASWQYSSAAKRWVRWDGVKWVIHA
ncbi:hypothetical protein BST61_g4251 [Cercospora zeina]